MAVTFETGGGERAGIVRRTRRPAAGFGPAPRVGRYPVTDWPAAESPLAFSKAASMRSKHAPRPTSASTS